MSGFNKKKYRVAIIGGGITGCCLAFELARRNVKDIVVIERGYIASGATGRCGAGFRHSWGTPLNAHLAIDSIDILLNINSYTGYDKECSVLQAGYLLPAYTEGELNTFLGNLELQHSLGVRSQVLETSQIKDVLPIINTKGMLGAAWNHDDGTADPFHCCLAFAYGARRLGVEIATYTTVERVMETDGRIMGLSTDHGDIECETVYNCANSWAPLLAAQVEDEIPIKNERHQAFVTEPVAPLGKDGQILPMIMSFSRSNWVKQTPHGSLLMGMDEKPEHSYNSNVSWDFLEAVARLNTSMLPILRKLRIVRQWAGFYDISPDHSAIVDFSEHARGLVHICGQSGHGFMIAPRIAIMVARHYCGEADSLRIENFSLQRYITGELLNEPLCV